MRTGRVMKRGFTLIETVVTVGIVAAMAAVVIPQVARQFDAADPARIQNDLKNIQTAMETYFVNIRVVPGDIDDLVNPIAVGVGNDSTLSTGTDAPLLVGSEATLWRGPYLDQSITQALLDDQIPTAYGAFIVDNFVCYNSGTNEHGISNATGVPAADDVGCNAAAVGTEQTYVAVQITGIACDTSTGSTFMTINELFDGAAEGTANLNGRVRCQASGGGTKAVDVNVVYFLAMPII